MKTKVFNWNCINLYRVEIMGFAALIITVMHLFVSFYEDAQIPYLTILLKRGNIGVDIFLLLSGCGLFYSMEKSSDILYFYKKRIKRVLIPYAILSLPYWLLLYWYVHKNLCQLLKDITLVSFWTQGITHYWFVAFILPVYLLYPWIYRLQKKNSDTILILCVFFVIISLSLALFARNTYDRIEIAITRVPVFLMGSYLGEILQLKENCKAKKGVFNLYFGISLVLFVGSVILNNRVQFLADMFYRYGSGGVALFLILAVSFILNINSNGAISKMLCYFGTITLEIYIISQSIRNGILVLGLGITLPLVFKYFIETGVFILSTFLSKAYKQLEKMIISAFV